MMTRSTFATLAVLTLALSGCAEADTAPDLSASMGPAASGPPFDPNAPLDEERLAEVVVTTSDLPSGFEEDLDPSDEDNSLFGCMARIDDLDTFGEPAATYDEASFDGSGGEVEGLNLFSGVGSYDSPEAAASSFNELREHVEACRLVKFKKSGGRWLIRLEADNDLTVEGDEQVNLTGSGKVRVEGNAYDVGVRFSVVRVGNAIVTAAIVGTTGNDLAPVLDPAFQASADRLIQIAD